MQEQKYIEWYIQMCFLKDRNYFISKTKIYIKVNSIFATAFNPLLFLKL